MFNYSDLFKAHGFEDVMLQKRFVMFKIVSRDGKNTKIPMMVNGSPASSTNCETWETFDVCEATLLKDLQNKTGRFSGIGIILGDFFGTKIVGVDIDHCFDKFSGEWVNKDAQRAVKSINTYCERSISGTGYHALLKDVDMPKGYGNRTKANAPFDLEVYEGGRYFTISFDSLNSNCLSNDQKGLNEVVSTYLPKKIERKSITKYTKKDNKKTQYVVSEAICDEVQRALRTDLDFKRLWEGERSGNESRDDFALISRLIHIMNTSNEDIITREFKKSPFYLTKDSSHVEKIENREDYMSRTISAAATGLCFPYSFDDIGNADMYTDRYYGQVFYVPEWNDWVCWNGSYFKKREELTARQYAKDLVKEFRASIKKIRDENPSLSSEEEQKLINATKHAAGMGYANRISAMLNLAQSSLSLSADEFDKDPMGVNCKNGYYDLKQNTFFPSDSKYRCTNVCGANYKEEDCPEFKKFLKKILPQDEVREFFEQAVGMAMLGKVYEEAMIFLVGDGCNGKSTLANILSQVMGTYSTSLQPDVITSLAGNKTPPDIAEVRGKRIVFISETEEGDTLSTKALKRLCSNEKLAVRRLYCMPEAFIPTHTIFYSTNHKPRVTSNDNGTWRRIKIIPFTYQFSEEEKITNFAEKLLEKEADGILYWCIQCAQKFISNGMKLVTPNAVKAEVKEYKDSEDVMAQFVNEMIDIKAPEECIGLPVDSYRTKSSLIFSAYKSWCKDNNYIAKNIAVFSSDFIKNTGCEKKNISGVKYWYRITFAK